MLSIIIALKLIEGIASDLHYCARSPAFYGLHLMADRIIDPLNDFVDSLLEVGFMVDGRPVPSSKTIYEAVAPKLTFSQDPKALLAALQDFIESAISEVEKTKANKGIENIFGDIVQHLYTSRGFILQTGKA